MAGTTPKASGAYIYGYDSAGNPSLTDLGSSDHKLPGRWLKGIEFVAHYSEIGRGHGGYNQDYEFFGYRQSI